MGVSSDTTPVLELDRVQMRFTAKGETVHAIDDVSMTVGRGEIVGLVGESGSGKSTLARCAVRLLRPTGGAVRLLGQDVTDFGPRRMRPLRKRVHMIFQDSFSAMNPRMSVGDIVAEPLRQQGAPYDERRARAEAMLDRVGLPRALAARLPHELSGGQRQRVGIARSLVIEPDLVVADEPVSALDVSIQASILNLIVDLQRDLGFSCLFITHDLSVVEYVADRIAVMYLGRIVETADRAAVFARPQHPYTQALLSASPIPDPVRQRQRRSLVLAGDVPSPMHPPDGCHLTSRCPIAVDECAVRVPPLSPVGNGGHTVRCHLNADPGGVPRLEPTDA